MAVFAGKLLKFDASAPSPSLAKSISLSTPPKRNTKMAMLISGCVAWELCGRKEKKGEVASGNDPAPRHRPNLFDVALTPLARFCLSPEDPDVIPTGAGFSTPRGSLWGGALWFIVPGGMTADPRGSCGGSAPSVPRILRFSSLRAAGASAFPSPGHGAAPVYGHECRVSAI